MMSPPGARSAEKGKKKERLLMNPQKMAVKNGNCMTLIGYDVPMIINMLLTDTGRNTSAAISNFGMMRKICKKMRRINKMVKPVLKAIEKLGVNGDPENDQYTYRVTRAEDDN
jgi:hypothetical protein